MSAPATDILINEMTEHDLLEVVEIEEASGLSRWGWAAYYAELQSRNRVLMLIARTARHNHEFERIAGYIVAREVAGEVHINNVAVRAQYRRRGIGEELLKRTLDLGQQLGATTAFLEVREGNLAAQSLYRKCGFLPVAIRSGYYSEPREDAVVMSLTFEGFGS